MADRRGLGARLRARRASPSQQRAYRLANSVRLPCALGLAFLLVLAVAIAVFVGRTGEGPAEVPRAVLDTQQGTAVAAAQSARRSLNEGVVDVDSLGRVVGATLTSTRGSREQPKISRASVVAFKGAHRRYTSVYVVAGGGRVLAGDRPAPDAALRAPLPPRPGVLDATPVGGQRSPLIRQFAPAAPPLRGATLVGDYDPLFLRFPLSVAEPGNAWLVNRAGQVVGSLGEPPRMVPLPRASLREAAGRATAGQAGAQSSGGSLERQEVVAWAPMNGFGPAGELGWGVVTTRAVTSFALPQIDAGRQGLLAGLVLGGIALAVFGWIYIIVLRPLAVLQREAERVAYGDLSQPVTVVRYDEIGLIARSLERARLLLIRGRAAQARTDARSGPSATKPGGP